jgi:hypothetical protein
MAGFPVLVKQGDFLGYRGQGSGGGGDVVAHLPGAVGPALQHLAAPRRVLGLCLFWCESGRGVLERGDEAVGLVLAVG